MTRPRPEKRWRLPRPLLAEIQAKKAIAEKEKEKEMSAQAKISQALKRRGHVNFDEASLASTHHARAPPPEVEGAGSSSSNAMPATMFGAAMVPGEPAEPDESKVNTSTHKKEWNQLERLMNGPRGASFPHMRQLFNGKQGDTCLHV